MKFNFKNSLAITVVIFLVCICSLKVLEYLYNRGKAEEVLPSVQAAPVVPYASQYAAPQQYSRIIQKESRQQSQLQKKQDICEMYQSYNDLAHEKNSAIIPEMCKE